MLTPKSLHIKDSIRNIFQHPMGLQTVYQALKAIEITHCQVWRLFVSLTKYSTLFHTSQFMGSLKFISIRFIALFL